jgi:hypothetical protein
MFTLTNILAVIKHVESDSIRYVSGMEVKCNTTGRPVQNKSLR